MCGRFGQINSEKKLNKFFNLDELLSSSLPDNFNVDIGNNALIILDSKPQQLSIGQFGFTPSWEQSRKYVFNARVEGDENADNSSDFKGDLGIFNKPYFRNSILKNRCLIPVNYFIEGPQKEKLSKPYLIRKENEDPFLLAGVFNNWVDKLTGEISCTFAILTTAQTEITKKIGHHRSPLIINNADRQQWLNLNIGKQELSDLMKPNPGKDFIAYPISPEIRKRNINGSNNAPQLIVPLDM